MILFFNLWNVLFSSHFQDICANLYYFSYIQFGELIFILITLGSNERQHSLTVQLAVLPPGPSGFPCSSQFFLDSSFVKLRGKYSLHVKCLLTMITDPMLTLLQLNKKALKHRLMLDLNLLQDFWKTKCRTCFNPGEVHVTTMRIKRKPIIVKFTYMSCKLPLRSPGLIDVHICDGF